MDLLDGAIWCRLLLRGQPMPAGQLAGIVDTILRGAGSPAGAPPA